MDWLVNHGWEILIAASAIGVQFLRLEGKVKGIEQLQAQESKRIDAAEAEIKNANSLVVRELRRLGEALARLEGHLGVPPKPRQESD